MAKGAHHGKEAQKGESGQAQPKGHPMKGEEAEEAERGGGDEATDLWSIDRVEVEILDFRPDESAFPQDLVQTTFYKASVDAGEVDKVKIERGLRSRGDDEEWDKSQRDWAIPEKAADHENEKEVQTMEELLVVGVLHLAHSTELIHPKENLLVGLWHSPFMPSEEPKDNLATFLQWAFGRR